jgi:hypothetical protein
MKVREDPKDGAVLQRHLRYVNYIMQECAVYNAPNPWYTVNRITKMEDSCDQAR